MISLHSINGCKGKMKKLTDSRGVLHKKEILEFIIAKSLKGWKGVQVQEIVKRTKLSRPTVTTHLNRLVDQDKIRKQIEEHIFQERSIMRRNTMDGTILNVF